MKLFKTKTFYLMLLTLIIILGFQNSSSAAEDPFPKSPPPGAPATFSELKRSLDTYHSGWLPDAIIMPGLKLLNMNGRDYGPGKRGSVYYGSYNDVPGNHKLRGAYRYSGMASDSATPFQNFEFIEDFATFGDVAGRNYVNYFWKTREHPYSFVPGSGIYNDPVYVQSMYFESTGRLVNGQGRIDFWLEGVDDKYSRAHDYWREHSSSFRRTDTNDQFALMTPQQRRSRIYIAMPPTNFTRGLAVTVYRSSVSASGYLYDTFMIDAFLERGGNADFKAERLDIDKLNSYTYEVNLTAKNIGETDVNSSVPSKLEYKIGSGPWQVVEGVHHGMDWTVNRNNKGLMGNISIPPGTPEGTRVQVRAEINHVQTSTGERHLEEDNVANNTIRRTFYTEKQSTCATGGLGTSKRYGFKVCNDWVLGEDGSYYCSATVNQYQNYQLSNLAEVNFETSKQTLTGVWSRTGDHLNAHERTPYIEGARVESDRFDYSYRNGKLNSVSNRDLLSYGISPNLIKSLNDLDINKRDIKKVIRAGRPVQMYSTIEVNLSLSSFSGNSDLNRKKDEFISDLVRTLETTGVKVSDGPHAVENHEGDRKVLAKLDKDRDYTVIDGTRYNFNNHSEGYMYKSEGSTTSSKYGDPSVEQITVYRKDFKFIIPVETFNDGGEQETNQGGLGSDYEVGDDTTSFYTNINTQDGLHGIAFGLSMNRNALDNSFSGSQYCRSPVETFEIKGNIFDDVRSEDESDVDFGDHDDEWDF